MEAKKRVLIIDPDKQWTDSLAVALLGVPYFNNVIVAEHGHRGLTVIKREQPDVIIMEMQLEIYDGLYLLTLMQRALPKYRPIVYIITTMRVLEIQGLYDQICKVCPHNYIGKKPQAVEGVVSNLCWFIENPAALMPTPSERVESDPVLLTPGDLDQQIDTFLRQLDSKVFLRRALAAKILLRILLTEQPENIHMGVLYRRVTEESNGLAGSAERNLRSFSHAAQENRTPYFLEHFPVGEDYMTNTDFYFTCYRILCRKLKIPWKPPHRSPMDRLPRR